MMITATSGECRQPHAVVARAEGDARHANDAWRWPMAFDNDFPELGNKS